MNVIHSFVSDFLAILFEMAPFLLLGFLFAGILHVFLPQKSMLKYFGQKNLKSVLYAALLGIPLPLCSCGVIPTGISLFKNGASKGASVSFFISTPQTGVDSILVTYSLLGLPFAVIRPFVALFTGIFGGFITNKWEKNTVHETAIKPEPQTPSLSLQEKIIQVFRYGFINFMQDIAKWLMIGLVLAALFSVFIPQDFFTAYLHHPVLEFAGVLALSIPLYVCATASVPIAAVLMGKGLSAGAALIFLMAGPATNIATMTMIHKVMGKKTLLSYLFSIMVGALFFAVIINYFLPKEWFSAFHINSVHEHSHNQWWQVASGIIILILIIFALTKKIFVKKTIKINQMNHIKIKVKGMTCQHCKTNVENNLLEINGITNVIANQNTGETIIEGENIDIEEVKKKITDIGYEPLNEE